MQKSARFKDEALQKAATPVVGNETDSPGDVRPDPSWTLERLAVYAKDEVSSSDNAGQQAILQATKSAIHLFRAGHALSLARDKCKGEKHGDWVKFKKKHGLADTTANHAIRLYENAKTEDALAGLGITEAKMKFGIAKPKKAKSAESPSPGARQPARNLGTGEASSNAEADAEEDDEDAGVSKNEAEPGKVQSYEGNTSKPAIDRTEGGDQEEAADETSLADETAQTLADELEGIAQRLSEIAQDDFGKVSWTKAEHRKAKTAIAAMNKYTDSIRRRLNNEDPIS